MAATVNGQVFKHDPITISGNLVHTPNQDNIILNANKTSEVLENLNASVAGTQHLNGSRVTIVNIEAPANAPPTNSTCCRFQLQ